MKWRGKVNPALSTILHQTVRRAPEWIFAGVFELTVSKEARRREEARKKRRNTRIAKSTVIGACVIVMPILAYLALRV